MQTGAGTARTRDEAGVLKPDSMVFNTSQLRDGRWKTHCPYVNVTATAKTRADAIQKCVTESFKRFYEIDAESRFPTAEGADW